MYAIISDRNNQATVRVGDEILCDLMGDAERGSSVTFDNILLVGGEGAVKIGKPTVCLLYTSPSPRDRQKSRMPSSA